MQFGYNDVCLAHDTGKRHPETADRLRAIRRALAKRHGAKYVSPYKASEQAIETVHESSYIQDIKQFCANGGGNWDQDTVASKQTWDAALASAGLAQWAAQTACEGASGRNTPFALGRPPGHHAVEDDAMGFCYINNAAVAAQTVLDDPSNTVESALIFDWDVHHGNGTQDIFYTDSDVLYASTHEEGLYPGTGKISETGTGGADGTTLNVPLPAGAGDADYLAVMESLLRPVTKAFDPDVFIVSAGFDAHRHDPISRMRVSTEGYALLTERVRTLADDVDAALAFVLEGGYGLDTLAEGVSIVHETFDGRDPMELDDSMQDSTTPLIQSVKQALNL